MLKTKGWDDKSSLKPDFFLSKARLVITSQMTETIENGCAIKFFFTEFSRQGLLMISFVFYALFHYGLFVEFLSSLCNIWAARPKRLDRIKNPLAM